MTTIVFPDYRPTPDFSDLREGSWVSYTFGDRKHLGVVIHGTSGDWWIEDVEDRQSLIGGIVSKDINSLRSNLANEAIQRIIEIVDVEIRVKRRQL